MAGQEAYLLEGGMAAPTLTASMGSGRGMSASGQQPHHGVIGLVIVAVAVLFLLDKVGFRFAVTSGRR